MKAYRQQKRKITSLKINQSTEGETIEQKVERIVNDKDPITDGAPPIYQERKDGVQAGYNIRTDRFEVALDAMDSVNRTHRAKREARIVKLNEEKDGKPEPTQGQADATGGNNQPTE